MLPNDLSGNGPAKHLVCNTNVSPHPEARPEPISKVREAWPLPRDGSVGAFEHQPEVLWVAVNAIRPVLARKELQLSCLLQENVRIQDLVDYLQRVAVRTDFVRSC